MSFLDFLKKDKTQGEPIEADAAQQEKEETGTRDVSGVVWPDMPPINPLRVSDRPMPDIELPKSAVIQPDRRDEVGMMLLSGELNPDTLRFLSVQELLLALTAVETWREQDLLSGAEDAYRKLFNEVINRIRGAERMFVLFDMSTGYPFIESGAALIFLEQDKAAHAMRLYSTQNRLLIVREVEGEGREVPEDEEQRGVTRTFFDYLYFLGIEYCVLDNGLYRLRFERTQIVAPPGDWGKGESLPDNPAAVYAILDFLQELRWKVGYAQRSEVLKAKEERMMKLLKRARFIVPTRPEGPAEVLESGLIRVDERTRVQFPMLQGSNGEQYQPVFTDGIEFSKRFGSEGWLGGVYTIDGLMKVATDKTGIVVNPDGQRLLLNIEHLKEQGGTEG